MQDRARETFEAMVADAPVPAAALSAFRRMLEETRDWPRAVEIQELLVKEEGSGDDVLAHLLAEQSFSVAATDPARARALAERATMLVPDGGHGLLALARARLASGDRPGAAPGGAGCGGARPRDRGAGVRAPARGRRQPRGVRAVAGELEEPLGERALPGVTRPGRGADPAHRQVEAVAVLQAAVDRTPRSVEARRALGELPLTGSSTRSGTSTARCCAGWESRCWPSGVGAVGRFGTSTSVVRGPGRGMRSPGERGTTTGEFVPLRSRA